MRRPAALFMHLNRVPVAALVLFGAYVLLSLTCDPGGYLGTDTGAKVATLEVMVQEDSWRPDVGYWAEDLDPDGELHPIYDAQPADDGMWVHVTTLPMLEAARPLYAAGGYRLALVLPMLGSVATAFAARSIARRHAGESVGWLAYWVVGLASPITVYALDLWEHSLGVAGIVAAVACLAGTVSGDAARWRAPAAGALLGVAATMRTEAIVYAIVAVGAACVWIALESRSLRRALTIGAQAIVGFAVPWGLNALLESQLGGLSRSTRATRAAGGLFRRLDDRLEEVVVTLLAIRADRVLEVLAIGGLSLVLLVLAVRWERDGRRTKALLCFGAVVVLYLSAIAAGLGFVPGLFAATPAAAAALAVMPRAPAERYAWIVALTGLPIVWSFQYLGGANPQWGGRYTLSSAMLLLTVGVVVLASSERWLRYALLGLTALVTATGVLWLGERSSEVSAGFDELVDDPADVVVVRNGFFIREGGAAYTERLWLTAVSDDDVEEAAQIVEESGFDSFAVLDERAAAPSSVGGFARVGDRVLEIVGVPFHLHRYELTT